MVSSQRRMRSKGFRCNKQFISFLVCLIYVASLKPEDLFKELVIDQKPKAKKKDNNKNGTENETNFDLYLMNQLSLIGLDVKRNKSTLKELIKKVENPENKENYFRSILDPYFKELKNIKLEFRQLFTDLNNVPRLRSDKVKQIKEDLVNKEIDTEDDEHNESDDTDKQGMKIKKSSMPNTKIMNYEANKHIFIDMEKQLHRPAVFPQYGYYTPMPPPPALAYLPPNNINYNDEIYHQTPVYSKHRQVYNRRHYSPDHYSEEYESVKEAANIELKPKETHIMPDLEHSLVIEKDQTANNYPEGNQSSIKEDVPKKKRGRKRKQ
ncbi:hypothetical protein K502DRAFT_347484 [Neoconidiobolus thromboides FSU 785]|nr:hypothetical protein K502DRAFT_347484 [Neoconidiobolus thromboides FSU 785]